jgi:hypothetical protein
MINKIDLLKLHNAEYLQLLTDILGIVKPQAGLQSDVQVGTLSILVAEMQILFRNDPSSPLSTQLAGHDTARDRLITGLVKLCDAHTYGPDPDKRAAADLLSHNLATYGAGIAEQSYQAESATITNIVAEWSTKPELTTAATLIGAEEWMTALQAANESFKTMYLRRTAEMSAGSTPDTFKAKRLEANDAWYKLRDRINSFFMINDGAAPWGTVTAQLNALIDQYTATLHTRAGRAAKAGKANNGDEAQGSERVA